MTRITLRRQGGHIVSLVCDGHTDYGVEGEDIVCAAVSSIVQTAVLGLMQVAGISPKLERDDERGYLRLETGLLEDEDRKNADMILETMLCGLSDMYSGYSDFIELEVK